MLRDATVLILDLQAITSQIGRPLPAILGREVFDAAVVEIDFPNHVVRFCDPATFRDPGPATVVPLNPTGRGVRSVPISIEGHPPLLVDFDLGHGGSLTLDKNYWEQTHLLDGRPSSTTLAGGVGGVREHRIGVLRSIIFAGATLNEIPTLFSEQAGLPQTLGARILSRFHLWVDYPRDRLFAVPGVTASTMPFPKDRMGAVVTFAADRLHVIFVAPGSPAATAGLRLGDDIVAIDGTQIGPRFADSSRAEWAAGKAGTIVLLRLADGRSLRAELADYF
jgi:hypothetical protein